MKNENISARLVTIKSTIETDTNWIIDYYDKAWLEKSTKVTDEEFEKFKEELYKKLHDDSGIVQQVNELMSDMYGVPGFPVFLAGASIIVLFHRIQKDLSSQEKDATETLAYQAMLNCLDRYIRLVAL
ncbi:MAG: hypothetical protein F6K34_27055 [Okeania sp. SIO4D6]|nr:hypothetical protein [Okeania sp. SIO4D6]NEP44769.1 hypothetical protein [Okeania sp. SIO2H7]